MFLQDGSNDWVDGPFDDAGDWWLGNLSLEKALSVSGYDVEHAWGEGGHLSWHSRAVLFDALRWLWRDHPAPIVPGPTKNLFLSEMISPEEGWMPLDEEWPPSPVTVPSGITFGDVVGTAVSPDRKWLAVTRRGSRHGWGFRVDPGGALLSGDRFYRFVVVDETDDPGTGPIAFDDAGRLYAASALGVQIFDDQGIARAILDAPTDEIVDLRITNAPHTVLDVVSRDGRAYRRRLKDRQN